VSELAGTGALMRLILRRDRIVLPLWVLLLSVLPRLYASSFDALFPTAHAREAYLAGTASNPSIVALLGRAFGSSVGALTAQRVGFSYVLVGLASSLTVIRHTRADEEAGRRELLGATAVGRLAPLAAVLIVTFAANLALAALVTVALMNVGLPAAGAAALGLALGVVGATSAAVGGVTAQLAETAAAARAMAVSLIGLWYLVRAAGDASGDRGGLSSLSWLSPIGWAQHLRPFADERWWILLPAVGLVVLLTLLACALAARRDLGAGVLPARPGPAEASRELHNPLALAWRLHRGLLFGWMAGFAVIGAVLGSAAKATTDALRDSSRLQDLLERLGGRADLSDLFLAGTMAILALAAAAYAIQASLRLRSEEVAQRAEPVLATAVGRLRWAASHLVFSVLGPAMVLATAGLTAGVTFGLSTGDVGRQVPRVVGAALVQLPAVWLLAGIAVVLFGLLPRFAILGWGALVAFLLLGQLGAVLQLNQWALDLSPFTHIPKLPGGAVSTAPLLWLVALTVMLFTVGLAGFRRRDIG
jgi:ABC-2 type transport system permease protein